MSNRKRVRPSLPSNDQVLTRLGRVTPNPSNNSASASPTTVVQNSGTFPLGGPQPSNADATNSTVIISHFDPEQYRANIKANGHDKKRLEQSVLNALEYFLSTSKGSGQQNTDYKVLILLSWTVSLHPEIFRSSDIVKALCTVLKGTSLSKATRNLSMMNNGNHQQNPPNVPYLLICQILWSAFQDEHQWPEDFLEAYVEDTLGEQNWIKNSGCQLFVSNIETAFHTRPSSWKLDRTRIHPVAPSSSSSSVPSANINDETSNDSNAATSNANESMISGTTEFESSSFAAPDENQSISHSDRQLISLRYEDRNQVVQKLQTLLSSNAKIKSTSGTSNNPNAAPAAPSSSSSGVSQPHETEKLLYLYEHICGLAEIRPQIISRLDTWLQNPKLNPRAEKLMLTLCENLTKPSASHSISNGYSKANETNSIDERSIEQLVNLRFKIRVSNNCNKMYLSCIREMLKQDSNLVECVVRFIIQNELQQISPTTALTMPSGKNPNNLPLLQACCQAQAELTCQSVAYTIQNILLGSSAPATTKDYENLLRSIRSFLRELLKYGKQEFDWMRFSMYLLDMHYSLAFETQFWTLMMKNDPLPSEITSNRLVKRLLECDPSNRERFLNAICDLIPMLILASAQMLQSSTSKTRSSSFNINFDQWSQHLQRVALIQCSACLFFWSTLSRVLDSNSTLLGTGFISCLDTVLFTAQKSSYTRIENWPSEEIPLNDLLRFSYETPILGETIFLLIQIRLTSHFRLAEFTLIELIEVLVRRTLNVEQKFPADFPSPYLRIPWEFSEMFLKKFFDLTLYIIRIPIQFPSDYQLPRNLTVTETFWKATLIALLIAAHDPANFGRFVWNSIPQIRLFMEMLLTGDYTYPPKSMIQSKEFLEEFYSNERIHLRKEKDIILELEKYLTAPRLIDETNSQLLGKVMLLDLQQIKRPSQEKNERNFYLLLQGLNNHYKLSLMLCRCRSPDFILEILNRKEHQSKDFLDSPTSWLTGLIDSNSDCLNVFPIVCLCDYFHQMISIWKGKAVAKKTEQALKTILQRFQSIIETVKKDRQASSTVFNDFLSIFHYFFQSINSNLSSRRSNAWRCLDLILNDGENSSWNEEKTLGDEQIEGILSTLPLFQSIDERIFGLRHMLIDSTQYETNLSLLHHSIVFLLEHSRFSSSTDRNEFLQLIRILIRRHSILYLLIKFDQEEKSSRLTRKIFFNIGRDLIEEILRTRANPMEIRENPSKNEEKTHRTLSTALVFPPSIVDFDRSIDELRKVLQLNSIELRPIDRGKFFVRYESIFIEFLLIFLISFEENTSDRLILFLQQIFFDARYSPSFIYFEEIDVPSPRRDNDAEYFKQFAVDEKDSIEQGKRRSSDEKKSEKIFLSTTKNALYQRVSLNNEMEQSLFHSDDLQYFIFKSKNVTVLKQCIDQATISTCLKMLKISVQSKENIRYVCQRLNQLIDSSAKQMLNSFKQSSLILPILNRWIIEGVPEAIKLGEKIFEKRKKSPSSKLSLLPTSSRSTPSIADQIIQYDRQLNESERKTSETEENAMDIGETTMHFPWRNPKECEEFLQRLMEKNFDANKRRQLLIELQWFVHQSDRSRAELRQALIERCRSADGSKFLDQLDAQSNSALVIFRIVFEKNSIETLQFDRDRHRSPFALKIEEMKRSTMETEPDDLRSILSDEKSSNVLIELLVQGEKRLSTSTVGMILDQLEKNPSSLPSSAIGQRLLLKQFLHSSSWSTLLHSINEFFSSSDRFDPRCILDFLEAFVNLSPLWSGRESKMFQRCDDEFLFDLNEEEIHRLIDWILHEGQCRSSKNENLFQQFQKRYQTILCKFTRNEAKRRLFQNSLEKFFVQSTRRKDLLIRFYFVLYINQSDLFSEQFQQIFPSLFIDIHPDECSMISNNADRILHDLLVRLNNAEHLNVEIHRLLKCHFSTHPSLSLRHLKMLKNFLHARLPSVTQDEFTRRISKQRLFFFAVFDLIQRLKPWIFHRHYTEHFHSILDLYLRLISNHLSLFTNVTKGNIAASNFLQEFLDFLDEFLRLTFDYFKSTRRTNDDEEIFPNFYQRFVEKFAEKIQNNADLRQALHEEKHNQIFYHLHQMKILYEARKSLVHSFDLRLSATKRNKFDLEPFRRKLRQSIPSTTIEEILCTLNELKALVDFSLTIDHLTELIEPLTQAMLNGHKQIMEGTYQLILKFIEKFPQHCSIFSSSYLKCLLSPHPLVFQMAVEHFPQFIIFFPHQSQQFFSLLMQQALIQKIDVTPSITQAIRLLNLHRYEPICYSNASNTTNEGP